MEKEEEKGEEAEVQQIVKQYQNDEIVKCLNCGWNGENYCLVVKKRLFNAPKSRVHFCVHSSKCGTRMQ